MPIVRKQTVCPVLIVFAVTSLLSGCGSAIHELSVSSVFRVDSVVGGKSYWVVAIDEKDSESNFRSHEAIGFVDTALSGLNYYEALSRGTADIIVEVKYAVDPPKAVLKKINVIGDDGPPDMHISITKADGSVEWITRENPSNDEISEKIIRITVYRSYLKVTARENVGNAEEEDPLPPLWSVFVKNEAESEKSRSPLSSLASVLVEYIGSTTGGPRLVNVDPSSEEVAFIEQGL